MTWIRWSDERRKPRHRSSRLLNAVTLIMLVAALAVPAGAYADGRAPEQTPGVAGVEDLGPAIYSPNVRTIAHDVLDDGVPVIYIISDGTPVSFNVVDARSGELLDSQTIDGYTVASSIEVAPDHTVYFSVRSTSDGGTLSSYDPQTQTIEELATNVVGTGANGILRSLVLVGDTLYGSTYPDAKVYSYHTSTGAIRDYGSVTEDGDYAWGLEVVDDNLWVGTGPVPHLMEVDPVSGAITERALTDEAAEGGENVSRVDRRGDLVVVSPRAGASDIFDLTNDEWISGLPGYFGPMTEEIDGKFYYIDSSTSTIREYDIAARGSTVVDTAGTLPVSEVENTNGLSAIEFDADGLAGTTLVGTRVDGSVWRYNLQTGAADVLDSQIEGTIASIQSLGVGGDGAVYVGAVFSAGVMARVGDSGEITQLSGPRQADSISALGSTTVVGTYSGAEFFAGSSDLEWDWGVNPEPLFGLSDIDQDRPLTMISAGDQMAAGTIPDYGELGGALVLFDPDTGEYEAHRDVVQDQSVTALAARDGTVYGGTGIHGGISSEPSTEEAQLFVWDIEAAQVEAAGVVVPSADVIQALTFDAQGRLWGLASNGVIFEYDTTTREVVQSIETPATGDNEWGRASELFLHPGDGILYGTADGRLFRFDPETAEFVTLLESGALHSTMTTDGTIYFADTTELYRYQTS